MNEKPCVMLLFLLIAALAAGFLTSSSSGQSRNLPLTLPPSETPPSLTITNVSAQPGETTALITWTTNLEADSLVRYGVEQGKYAEAQGSTTYVREHKVVLENLQPGSTYYYRVGSITREGVAAETREYNFTTRAVQPPAISGFKVKPGSTSALLEWNTNVPSRGVLLYSLGDEGYTNRIVENSYNTTHTLLLQALTPGNPYHLILQAVSEKNVSSEAVEQEFETLPAESGEAIRIWNLTLAVTGLIEHVKVVQGVNRSFSRAEIELSNQGEDIITVSLASTAVLNERGDQFSRVALGEQDEFTSADVFPGGRLRRALYYERVSEGNATLHLSLKISNKVVNLKARVHSSPPEHVETELSPTPAPPTQTLENNITVTLDDFDPSFEITSGTGRSARSYLYARVDITVSNTGGAPVELKLKPEPGLVDDAGNQHLYVKTGHKDELPLGTLHPSGSISGALFFSPEVSIHAKSLTLYVYLNGVEHKFIFNPGLSS